MTLISQIFAKLKLSIKEIENTYKKRELKVNSTKYNVMTNKYDNIMTDDENVENCLSKISCLGSSWWYKTKNSTCFNCFWKIKGKDLEQKGHSKLHQDQALLCLDYLNSNLCLRILNTEKRRHTKLSAFKNTCLPPNHDWGKISKIK